MVAKFNGGRVPLRVLGIALASALLAVGLVIETPPQAASAISGSEFDPGNIISDSEFYNGSAMTEAEIQTFLNSKSGVLKTLRQNVDTRPRFVSQGSGLLVCEEIKGGSNLLASTIIHRAQVACGISAKVILVTLQKEQGLITDPNPTSRAINFALGNGCPDTPAGCAADYQGFGYQVYSGTHQLKIYKAHPDFKQPGTLTLGYHPDSRGVNPRCGSKTIVVSNYATAALYNYTPYVPNAAALANLGGTGDSCSSYGNRNFWNYYYSWFGNPTDITPSAAVERIGGADRYEVSAAIARANYSSAGVDRVYVATGASFADALSISTAAAIADAPLLLVTATGVPSKIRTELARLAPSEIVVLGGPSVISEGVVATLETVASASLSGPVQRISGTDRYETSRLIARAGFPLGSTATAFIATGTDFPDALSASSAAARAGGPLIMVKGDVSSIDAETVALLADLGVTKVSIAGGSGVVSAGIEAQLVAIYGAANVKRYGGANRYETSIAINGAAFTSSNHAYFATGSNFPDALSGAAVAGASAAPLYVVRATCVPKPALQAVEDFGVTKVFVLGGAGALSSSVASYKNC